MGTKPTPTVNKASLIRLKDHMTPRKAFQVKREKDCVVSIMQPVFERFTVIKQIILLTVTILTIFSPENKVAIQHHLMQLNS